MAVADRPETFVALRARHEAFRIASDFVRGPGVDVEHLDCHACGAAIDWRLAIEQICVDCPACGAVNELPCHLRYRIPPANDAADERVIDYASSTPDARQWWNNPLPLAYAAAEPVDKDQRAPMWLNVFCLACLAIVLVSLVLMAFRAHL
jgi:hypothetical protein